MVLLLAPGPAQAGELGAFFALSNTYAFAAAPGQGQRLLIRSRLAYPVVDERFDDRDRLWYQLQLVDRKMRREGSGWIALNPDELASHSGDAVQVFAQPVEPARRGFGVLLVPARDIQLLQESQDSASLPRITWHKVRFVTMVPAEPWLRASTGIYRPGKSTAFLSQSFADLVTHGVAKEDMNRLLAGVVRVGDSTQQVRWALGEPLRTWEETQGQAKGAKDTVWEYPEAQISFENATVKQVR
ncbi:MAG TPA: hypothetical protein VL359_16500 [bacterium]|nr:hypothetical protein [bacterium]